MFASFFKKNLPHILALAALFLITVVYFSPMVLDKKELVTGDVMQGIGGQQELVSFQKETGEQSLWTNSLFSGMPSVMVHTVYNRNIFATISYYISLGLPRGADMVFLSLLGFYILLSIYGVRPILATAGAFAYAFSTYSIVSIEAGHFAKVTAMAYMPVILAGIVYAYRKNILVGCAIMALGLALNLLTKHVQITFYVFLAIGIFGISELIYSIQQKTIKKFVLTSLALGFAAAVAVGTNAGYLLSVEEYGKYSIRGKAELTPDDPAIASEGLDKDYAFDWSYTPVETMTLLIPRFYGGSSNENLGKSSETYKTLTGKGVPANSAKDFTQSLPTYWGDLPFTSGPLYVGAIIIFLFVLGMVVAEGQLKYWLFTATVLSLFLTWGKNFESFNYFLFDHLPLFNKFRAVMMAIVIAQLCMPVLAIVALERMLSSTENKEVLKKKILYAFGLTGGLCLLVALGAGMFDFNATGDVKMLESFKNMTGDAGFAQQIMDSIISDRESLMRNDAFRSSFLISLVAGAIFLFVIGKIKQQVVVIVAASLIFLDLWMLDKNYLNNANFQRKGGNTFFAPSPADEYILKDTTKNYRVYNISGNPFTENRTSYFHKSIGGNNPAKLRRYQDLIEKQLSKNNEKVLNMLNAKYAIISPEQPPQLIPGALGNAWFVQEIKKVKTPDEEMAALDKFEPAYTAVVDVNKFKIGKESFDTTLATIELKEYKPNYLKYTSNSSAEKLAVFSEIYYPIGWTATIDGNPVDILRANYVLRAMYVPAGTHTIEMKFDMPTYHIGEKISLICSFILLGGLVGVVLLSVVKKKNEKNE
jgi:hypothetical protein